MHDFKPHAEGDQAFLEYIQTRLPERVWCDHIYIVCESTPSEQINTKW